MHPLDPALFPNSDAVFQDSNLAHTQPEMLVCVYVRSTKMFFNNLWLAQLPTLNIIKQLWSALEGSMRSRLPPLSLKQPEEEWYGFPLEAIQNLRQSVPRRIQAVLQANGGPTPY
jgi:hypothetical protein